jgi:hypothetical protein
MKYEIAIYILIACALFVYRTVLSGRKNGAFYHKNDAVLPPMLEQEIKNLHFIETSAWYCQTLGVFFLLFGCVRSFDYTLSLWPVVVEISIAGLITLGTVQTPSYHYQRGITAGLKDDDHLDATNQSEVAITIFGKKIQFWKGRLFSNKNRIIAQWMGVAEIITGVLILMYKDKFKKK